MSTSKAACNSKPLFPLSECGRKAFLFFRLLGYVLNGIPYLCCHYHHYHLIALPLQTEKQKSFPATFTQWEQRFAIARSF